MKTICVHLLAAGLLVLGGCKKAPDSQSGNAGQSANPSSATSAASAAGQPDDPALLKIQWPVGARLVQRMELAQTMNIPMPGAGKPMKQEVNFAQDFALSSLRERDGGGREVELEFLAANMSVSMNGSEVLAFDTRGEATGDESNPAVRPFRQMLGKKIKYLLDSSNQIERVEGVKEFTDQIFGSPSAAANPMASMFNEDYFKQIMSHDRDLPAGPVKPGATWPSRREISMGPLGKAVLNFQFTFKRWDQHDQIRCALLEFDGTITPLAGDTNNTLSGMVALQDGTGSGKTWFDPARGLGTDTAMKLVMNMRIKSFGGPGAPGADPAGAATALNQNISIKLIESSRK